MKASELRIGNLVMDGHDIEEVNYRMIEMLVENEAEFDPIPLTEEWLLKFEFRKDGKYNSADRWMGIFNQPLIQGNGYFTIPNYPTTEIKHVHQLQNLYFALTGEELEIKE